MFLLRVVLFATFFFGSFSAHGFSAEAGFLTVQVRHGQLRSAPSFMGKVTAIPAYGDRVKLVEDKGAWKKVVARKNTGWMHESALTAKTLILQAGKSDVNTGASKGELALAGKGFNSKVEAEFKSKNSNIQYSWVNQMEDYVIKPGQMQSFLKQGQVVVPEWKVP